MMRTSPALALAGLLLAACGPSLPEPAAPPPPPQLASDKVGSGYYVTELPKGDNLPSDAKGKYVKPKVTDDFKDVPTSNEWWSSLIWHFEPDNPYSENLYAHPFAARAEAGGLALSYPTKPEIKGHYYMYWHDRDLLVGLEGMRCGDARVAAYSDWTVTAHFEGQGGGHLRATLGHGLPFVYFTRKGDEPVAVSVARDKAASLSVFHEQGSVLGVSVGDHHYALFAPSGSRWRRDGDTFRSDLGGKDYFSVAVLPDRSSEALKLFHRHAYAFVTGSKVSWKYDQAGAKLVTRFQLETVQKESGGAAAPVAPAPEPARPTNGKRGKKQASAPLEAPLPAPEPVADTRGFSKEPLVALYRHQWLHSFAPFLKYEYVSPRGKMKLMAGSEFSTELPWRGILPTLPNVAEEGQGQLEFYVKENYKQDDLFPPGLSQKPERDTYWVGKSLGKHANVLQIADQLGDEDAREHLLMALKNQLQDWFDGQAPRHFYYDETWRTLIGFPEAYMSSAQMNDHHFHYGYFVYAAAIVARFDPKWAEDWGDFVNLLIRDVANWKREDKRFPFLRYMDPYAGYSQANGPQLFKEGNNEEASSEDINFSTGVILWGALTGNDEVRDLGIYLYATQVSAIGQYWFDVDNEVWPEGFPHPVLAMVWGAGGWYNTWFDEDPNVIHGINYLPFTGGSLYHGLWPETVQRNYANLDKLNNGQIWTWRDYILMYLATADPKKALALYEEDQHLALEFGNSRASLHHWLHNLNVLGRVDKEVTADVPTYAVFSNDGKRTYVAFNPEGAAKTVRFSDGTTLEVAPRALKVRGDHLKDD
jgi:endoglucanase Acf2